MQKHHYLMNKLNKILLAAALVLMPSATLLAKAIVQIGDRYILNVPELQLCGDETALDVLMMCPDIMTQDARTTSSLRCMGNYAVRVDNIDIKIDQETFLKNTRASELQKIVVCLHPHVMKGSSGLRKVIDLYFRTDTTGTHAKVYAEGDTQASGTLFARATSLTSKLSLMGQAVGKSRYASSERLTEADASVHAVWTPTPKDHMRMQVSQTFQRTRPDGLTADYNRQTAASVGYDRTLNDKGAYIMFVGGADYTTSRTASLGPSDQATSPFAAIEFASQFLNPHFYITTGIEYGMTYQKHAIADYANRESYEDLYVQLDFTSGRWGASYGNRFRTNTYWLKQLGNDPAWEHTTANDLYLASVWYEINDHNTIQARFSHRFYAQDHADFVDDSQQYTIHAYKKPVYISELRHTLQHPSFNLTTLVKNIHQHLAPSTTDHILMTGFSMFAHAGILRLTAGANYCWERMRIPSATEHTNWVSLHLAPQITPGHGWRFTANAIYNSRRADLSMPLFYSRANCYLDVQAARRINRHLLVEAKWHDIVDQRVGTRGASLGLTYTL